jgi:hypothetical protein
MDKKVEIVNQILDSKLRFMYFMYFAYFDSYKVYDT